MQRIKLNLTKLDKSAFFKGAKGTYADLTLLENRDGKNEYGDDGFVVQDLGKERREAGEKGPIVGNWRHVETRGSAPKAKPAAAQEDDSIPF